MLQQIISYIGTLDPALIYVVLFFFAFIENIFPPSPSDFVVIVGATLISKSTLGIIPILLLTSVGSAIGFIVMYFVGEFLGEKLLRSGKFKFIKQESLDKADRFFHKYGYNIILINRFLPGTRAVVSFFSGVHKLKPMRTFIYAGVSSFVWNAILIFLGIQLGNNLELVDKYLSEYSQIIFAITAVIIIFVLVRFWMKKKKSK
ncbi:MAG: DedA family protein [Ignavibacteriales bacterium]|nr:MAG: DedA family protein [Ignavibacteriales bacterium]